MQWFAEIPVGVSVTNFYRWSVGNIGAEGVSLAFSTMRVCHLETRHAFIAMHCPD